MEKLHSILDLIEKYKETVIDWHLGTALDNKILFIIKMEVNGENNFHSFCKEFEVEEVAVDEIEKILDKELEKAKEYLV